METFIYKMHWQKEVQVEGGKAVYLTLKSTEHSTQTEEVFERRREKGNRDMLKENSSLSAHLCATKKRRKKRAAHGPLCTDEVNDKGIKRIKIRWINCLEVDANDARAMKSATDEELLQLQGRRGWRNYS